MRRDREEGQNPQTVAQGKACRYLASTVRTRARPRPFSFIPLPLSPGFLISHLHPLSLCLYPLAFSFPTFIPYPFAFILSPVPHDHETRTRARPLSFIPSPLSFPQRPTITALILYPFAFILSEAPTTTSHDHGIRHVHDQDHGLYPFALIL